MIGISWKNVEAKYAVKGDKEALERWLHREECDFRVRKIYAENRGRKIVVRTGIMVVPVEEYID